jgi:hypothetical protein
LDVKKIKAVLLGLVLALLPVAAHASDGWT